MRTLLIGIAMLCGLFAWAGAKFNRVRQQRQAIAELKAHGFDVLLEYEDAELVLAKGTAEPPGPRWLRSLLGDDFFADATCATSDASLDLDGSTRDLGNGELQLLATFPHLRAITFTSDIRITDEKLASLCDLPELAELRLNGCPITDAGMAYVAKLRRLCYLDVSETAITDAGLSQLSGSPSLMGIVVRGTQVTQRGTNQLHGIVPRLTVVH